MLVRLIFPVVLLLFLCSSAGQKMRETPIAPETAIQNNFSAAPSSAPASTCELRYDSAINRAYYVYVDEPASYRGGMDSLQKTLQRNIRYPHIDHCEESGTVWISFIIEPDGTISNKKLVKPGPVPAMNAEALRVIDSLKDWVPGRCQGEKVPVLYYFPVKFVMQ